MLESVQIHKLRVGEREINYTVMKKAGTKDVHLTLKPNLALEVSIPASSRVDVNAILRKKKDWIRGKLAEILECKKIFDGGKILYKGDYHELVFIDSTAQKIRIDNGKLVMPSYSNINLKQVLKDWMKQETEKLVEKRLAHLKRKSKPSIEGFSVRDIRKWAHCTRDNRIVFNPQLIALPSELANYVILHEVTHLTEFSHSRRFKYALASVCPDFKEKELLLKQFVAFD